MGLAVSIFEGVAFVGYILACATKAILPTSFSAPRVGHTALGITLLAKAYLLGLPFFMHQLDKAHATGRLLSIHLVDMCNGEHLRSCQAAQIIYRASMVLFVYYVVMAIAGGAVHYIYAKLWPLKFLFAGISVAAMLFVPVPEIFGIYAEVARVLSLIWLIFQGFLVLDVAHDLHDIIGSKAEEQDTISGSSGSIFSSWWRILYLTLSVACLVAAGFGMAAVLSGHAACTLGAALAGITLAVGVLTIAISLLEGVGVGLLPPSILFAYSTFLCWYAMLSHPDPTCNVWAEHGVYAAQGKTVGIAISTAILTASVIWITWHGEKVLDLFGIEEESLSLLSGEGGINTEKEEDDDNGENAPESRQSRIFYLGVMACASAFAAMALTSWARPDGLPESSGTPLIPMESLWLKIASQWTCLIMQIRVLWVTYRDNRDSSSYRSF